MPIDQCKQQLEHAAQFATPTDLRSEVQKQLALLDAGRQALDTWPSAFRGLNAEERAKGPRHYTPNTYATLGL
jgi:hypothetical protein